MAGPRFSTLDSTPAQEVRRIGTGEGATASAFEKWLDFSPRYLSLWARWDPGMMVHAHGHLSDNVVFVLEGEMTCGDVRCTPGTHIALDQGDTFGPFVAGPEGVVLFEVMMGDPRSFPADPDGWNRLLAEKGATQLPNPEIDLPGWLEDTRSG
jgi:mannose-6-phosphate isomerase-like protein (cupin superfamily)